MPRAASAVAAARGPIWLAAMAIVVVGAAVYTNSIHGTFVFDDLFGIVENRSIRHLWPPDAVLAPPPTTTVEGRPVVNLSLALNYAVDRWLQYGFSPGSAAKPLFNVIRYHIFNITVHLSAALVLFAIVRRTLARLGGAVGARATLLALVSALIWVVHPVQTESVTYTIQRAESMAGLFYLLTLYLVLRGSVDRDGESLRPLGWYLAAVAACLTGMATKEIMATAPLVVLAYDRIFLATSFRELFRRRWPLYLALAATWLPLAGLVYSSGSRGDAVGFDQGVSGWQYLVTQFGVIVHYLRLCFWPRPLIFDYGHWLATTPAEIVPPACLIGVLVLGTLVALRYRPAFGFLGIWFFCILAPSSSIVPIVTQTAAEHRLYLPLAAVVVGTVIGIYLFGRWCTRSWAADDQQLLRLAAGAGTVAVIALLGFGTIQRNLVYATSIGLWEDTVAKRPNNERAHQGLALALLLERRPRAAIRAATRSLELKEDQQGHTIRGRAWLEMGQPEQAKHDFDRALELMPDHVQTHYNRGLTEAYLQEYDEALVDLTRAIELLPDFPDAYLNRGTVYAALGRAQEAREDFDRVIELDPTAGDAYLGRASANSRLGRAKAAWQDLQQAETLGAEVGTEVRQALAEAAGAQPSRP
jgi:protein O-mannosyl-transferase